LNKIGIALSCGYAVPFFITIVAAAGASLMIEFHKKFNRRSHEQEASFLFFASLTALFIIAAWHDPKTISIASSLTSAVASWAGYGIGLTCFTSLGVRLHPITISSRLGGIALFYLTVAIIALTIIGVSGLLSR
jgi:hypothetical protein